MKSGRHKLIGISIMRHYQELLFLSAAWLIINTVMEFVFVLYWSFFHFLLLYTSVLISLPGKYSTLDTTFIESL